MGAMDRMVRIVLLLLCLAAPAQAVDRAIVLSKVNALPMALSHDFEFRKTKIYLLTRQPTKTEALKPHEGVGKVSKSSGGQNASVNFERQYRMFGAVTALDQRQRSGQYFDFFWRAHRPADVTVRFEYRQEKLRAFAQARELSYPRTHGTQKSEFAIVGDDYFDDGRVIAWRCLLIESGRIVAENRSYLWEK